MEEAGPQKMTSAKIRPILNFSGADVQTFFAFSVVSKPINLKILPPGTIYSKNSPGNAFKSKFERMDPILISSSNP